MLFKKKQSPEAFGICIFEEVEKFANNLASQSSFLNEIIVDYTDIVRIHHELLVAALFTAIFYFEKLQIDKNIKTRINMSIINGYGIFVKRVTSRDFEDFPEYVDHLKYRLAKYSESMGINGIEFGKAVYANIKNIETKDDELSLYGYPIYLVYEKLFDSIHDIYKKRKLIE